MGDVPGLTITPFSLAGSIHLSSNFLRSGPIHLAVDGPTTIHRGVPEVGEHGLGLQGLTCLMPVSTNNVPSSWTNTPTGIVAICPTFVARPASTCIFLATNFCALGVKEKVPEFNSPALKSESCPKARSAGRFSSGFKKVPRLIFPTWKAGAFASNCCRAVLNQL